MKFNKSNPLNSLKSQTDDLYLGNYPFTKTTTAKGFTVKGRHQELHSVRQHCAPQHHQRSQIKKTNKMNSKMKVAQRSYLRLGVICLALRLLHSVLYVLPYIVCAELDRLQRGMLGMPFNHMVSFLQVHSCSAVCRDVPLHCVYNIFISTHCIFRAQ